MPCGVVKFFDPVKGFGFATLDDGGGECFLGRSELSRTGIETLKPGQRLSFEIRPDDGGKSMRAVGVRILDSEAP